MSQTTKSQQGKAKQEEILRIKREKQKIMEGLPINSLYIVMHIRSDPPDANDFHWGYYHHTHSLGGNKYHITNLKPGTGWMAGHGDTRGVLNSLMLCVLIQVGHVPADRLVLLDETIRCFDSNLNVPGRTCRTWTFDVMDRLIQQGFIRCGDGNALQHECMMIGNQHRHTAARAAQPRPIVRSALCTFPTEGSSA